MKTVAHLLFCLSILFLNCNPTTPEHSDNSSTLTTSDLAGTWKQVNSSIGYMNEEGIVDSIGENPVDGGVRYLYFSDSLYAQFGYQTNLDCRLPFLPLRYTLNRDTLRIPGLDQAAAAEYVAQGYEYNNIRIVEIRDGVLKIANTLHITSQNRNLSPYVFYDEYTPVAEVDSSAWPVGVCR